ncbi:hypothetical protein V3O24_13790 [Methylobacter sp. Wu8]|uniref:hypothetical protein n=1 Tax=Methylobacter sp. Wu8 TaxID=3118457 RepID=UPI002F2D41FE
MTEAAQFAFERLGIHPNESLPPEKHQEFIDLMMERITPFIAAHMKKPFQLD